MANTWAQDYGLEPAAPKPRNAIAAGLSSGLDDLKGLGLSAAAAVADTFGATGARDYLNERADVAQYMAGQNGRPDLDQIENVYDKPSKWMPYLGYQLAKQVPIMAGAITAGVLVPQAAVPAALARAAALGPRAAGMGGMAARVAATDGSAAAVLGAQKAALRTGQTFANQVVGGGAFNAATGAGSLYQESVEGGDPNAGPISLLGALPYALTETLPQAMLVGRVGHGALKGGLGARVAKAAATQAPMEAGTELVQNEMEMAYHGSVTPEQAASRRLNSAAAGGLVGGVFGSAGGLRSGAPRAQVPGAVNDTPDTSTDILTPPLQLGWDGYSTTTAVDRRAGVGGLPTEGQTPFTTFPDGSTATSADTALMEANGVLPDQLAAIRDTGAPGPAPHQMGQMPPRFDPTMAAQGAQGVAPYLPGTMVADQGGQVALDAQGADSLYGEEDGDPGLAEARRRYLEAEGVKREEGEKAVTLQAAVQQKKAERDALQARTKHATGIASTKAIDLFGALERQRTAGLLDDDGLANDAALITRGEFPKVASAIKARDAEVLKAQQDAAAPKETPNAGTPAQNGAPQAADVGRSPAGTVTRVPGPGVAQPGAGAAAQTPVVGVAPAAVQPGAGADAAALIAPAAPRVTRQVAAKTAEKAVDAGTGAPVTKLAYVEPAAAHEAPVAAESVDQRSFRKSFGGKLETMPVEDRLILEQWLGVEMVPSDEAEGANDLELTGSSESYGSIGKLLTDQKTGKRGISKQAVAKRVKAALVAAGAPADISPAQLYKKLGFQLGDMDLEALDRMTADWNGDLADDAAPAKSKTEKRKTDAQTNAENDAALNDMGAAASDTRSGWAGDELTALEDDNGVERSADDEAAAEKEVADNAALREAERNITLDDILGGDLVSGAVTQDDIAEATFLYDKTKGSGAWGRLQDIQKATAARYYAQARLHGDAAVLETKKAIYERDEATAGGQAGQSGQVSDALAASTAPQGAARSDEGADVRGSGGLDRGQRQEVDGDRPQPVVKTKRTLVRAEAPATDVAPRKKGTLGAKKAAPAQAAAQVDPDQRSFAEAPTNREMELRAKAHEVEAPGDILLGNGKFVSFEDAKAAAKAAIDAGALRNVPFQYNNVLDIAPRDWDRMVAAMDDYAPTPGATGWGDARFSQGSPAPKKLTQQVLERAVQQALAHAPNAPSVTVVDSPASIPGASVPAGLAPSGGVVGGRIYLFRDNLGSVPEALRTVFHELFHYGLSRVLPKEQYIQTMMRLRASDPKVREYAARWEKSEEGQDRKGSMPIQDWRALGAEEALADIAEEIKTGLRLGSALKGTVGNIVQWAASVADKLRMPRVAQALRTMTYTEAEKFVASAVSAAERGTEGAAGPTRLSTSREALNRADAASASRITAALPPRVKSAWTDIKDVFNKKAPWLLTSFQLAEQHGDKIKSLPVLMKINDQMRVESTTQQLEFDAVADRWGALSKDERAKLDKVALRATMLAAHPDLPFGHKENAHLKRKDPVENAAQMAKHAALAAQYNAMLKPTRDIYQEAKTVLEKSRDRMVEETKKLQDAYGIKKSIPDKTPGPYFPLNRFGEYLAIGESKAYQALADEVANASDEARPELAKKLDVMKGDRKHFIVSAHESRSAMAAAEAEYSAEGLDARTSLTTQRLGALPRELHKMVQEMAAKMAGSFPGATANAVVDAYTEMLMKALPEMNALNRQAQRVGVEGASPDMKRAFAATGRQGAFYTSRLMYGRQAATAMLDMKAEVKPRVENGVKKGSVDLQHIHHEMEKRNALNMVFQDTPIQNVMSQAGHMWYLAASPTYLLMNMMQPWLVTAPVLAGKYGLADSTRALARASKEALLVLGAARWKDGKWSPWEGISEKSIPGKSTDEARKALRELIQRGIVVEGLTHEMEMHASGSDGKFAKLARGMGWAAEQVEITNRIATALATFRLARASGLDYDAAVQEAYAVTVNTQMDYSQENTARFMREGGGIPAAKLIFQFRRYQQAMLYLLFSNIKRAWPNKSGPDATAARSTLAYFALTSSLSAGVLGLPFMSVALGVVNAFKDDDDEDGDAETVLRNALFDLTGDKDLATVLAKGLPAMVGADLSKRIGLGDIASPFPMLDLSGATGQDKVGRLAAAVAGPVLGGLGASAFDAASYFSAGDLVKGTEKILPKVAADVLRAARLGTQGMTDRKGEQILGVDEIGAWDTVLRALGTTPTEQSNYYEGTRALKNTERAVEARKGRIQHEYVAALADGDMADVRAKIEEFNADHPSLPIKPKDETAWRKNARRSASQRDETGIKFDPKRDGSYADTLRFAR